MVNFTSSPRQREIKAETKRQTETETETDRQTKRQSQRETDLPTWHHWKTNIKAI